MTFKDEFTDFQHLVLNLLLVRRHNLMTAIQVVQSDERLLSAEKAKLVNQQVGLLVQMPPVHPQAEARLLFAEGALAVITLERFLRMILGKTGEAYKNVTLVPLLAEATGTKKNLLTLVPGMNKDEAIKTVGLVRNTMLHGNWEQITQSLGYTTVPEFFQKGFTPAVELLYQLLAHFVQQIDPHTGRPHAAASKRVSGHEFPTRNGHQGTASLAVGRVDGLPWGSGSARA